MAEISKRKRKNKKREAWEKVMSSFTDDLWTEILLRLPIKSLLRFKSMIKLLLYTWNQMTMILTQTLMALFPSFTSVPNLIVRISIFLTRKSSTKTRVSNFNDTIAVIFCTMDNGKIQLWTLDNEACLCGGGVQALWTKVLSIDVGLPLYLVEGLYNNSQFLVVGRDGNRFMYDLNKKVTKNFTGPYFEATEIFKYTASIFSLEGFKRIKWAASFSSRQDSSDSDVEMDE
ncbi:uncharacterized protein LOC141681011 [Apium graveolens]|uniref:uncharacterized protein LOC141681011 n=1 Tax=Apium graveolens TaxID=4045 RepID=UPI003D7A517E